MSKAIMLDLEAWGTGPDATIISIGAVKFDPIDPNVPFDNFHVAVDPRALTGGALARKLEIDPETVMWWMDPQRDAARAHWLASVKLDLPTTLVGFAEWFGSESLPVWGNGSTFDNVILRRSFAICGLECPWKFWDDRCHRTLKNLRPDIKAPTAQEMRDVYLTPEAAGAHTALYDAQSQAIHLIHLMAALLPSTAVVPTQQRALIVSTQLVQEMDDNTLRAEGETLRGHPDPVAIRRLRDITDEMERRRAKVEPEPEPAPLDVPVASSLHFCPRRYDSLLFTSSDPQKLPDEWSRRNVGVRTCSFCGSLHPDEFMDCAESGLKLVATDKSYKSYVDHPRLKHAKFYFEHLSPKQRQRFVELLNEGKLNYGDYPLYVDPFFVTRKKV